MWVFVDGDNGDNEMIMQTIKNGLHGPFGPLLKILAAENDNSKKRLSRTQLQLAIALEY